MSRWTTTGLLIGFTLPLTFPVSAQIDAAKFASDLRERYGPPLSRETFEIRPGVQMIVDFAQNGHVCRIHLPAVAASTDPGQQNVRTPKAIDDLVLELVPPSMRVGEPERFSQAMSRISASSTIFENVTISESRLDDKRTGVTISFPKEQCPRN